jgi:hypothetical protein
LSASSSEGSTPIPLIHLESIELPHSAVYVFTISRTDGGNPGFEREVEFHSNRSRGCAFSVKSIGNYSLLFRSIEHELNGRLAHDGIHSFSASSLSDNLFAKVTFSHPTPTPLPSPSASQTDVFTTHWGQSHRSANLILGTPNHRPEIEAKREVSKQVKIVITIAKSRIFVIKYLHEFTLRWTHKGAIT